jgi:hypothetical protein
MFSVLCDYFPYKTSFLHSLSAKELLQVGKTLDCSCIPVWLSQYLTSPGEAILFAGIASVDGVKNRLKGLRLRGAAKPNNDKIRMTIDRMHLQITSVAL